MEHRDDKDETQPYQALRTLGKLENHRQQGQTRLARNNHHFPIKAFFAIAEEEKTKVVEKLSDIGGQGLGGIFESNVLVVVLGCCFGWFR